MAIGNEMKICEYEYLKNVKALWKSLQPDRRKITYGHWRDGDCANTKI